MLRNPKGIILAGNERGNAIMIGGDMNEHMGKDKINYDRMHRAGDIDLEKEI